MTENLELGSGNEKRVECGMRNAERSRRSAKSITSGGSRCRRTEVGGQRSEVRGRRTDVGRQKKRDSYLLLVNCLSGMKSLAGRLEGYDAGRPKGMAASEVYKNKIMNNECRKRCDLMGGNLFENY
jgi:hypothetical protein